MSTTQKRKHFRHRNTTLKISRKNLNKMWDSVQDIKTDLSTADTNANANTDTDIHNNIDPILLNPDKSLDCDHTCIQCQAPIEYQSNGFGVCTNASCSQICENILDQSPEWRFYGADDAHSGDPSRCGAVINPLMKDAAFGCRINLIKKCSREMHRLGKYTEWMTPYDQKVLYKDFQHITIMSQNAGIPKIIIDSSFVYYKRFLDYEQSFRGENKGGLIAAATYTSCRINKCPRSAKELAAIYHINPAAATNGCKLAQKILNELESDLDPAIKTIFCTIEPQDFIERYCSRLNFPDELVSLSLFITKKVTSIQYMAENTPNSIAAGVAYFVSTVFHLNISKVQVKLVSEISEMTINKCYKKLMLISDRLIPVVLLRKYGYESQPTEVTDIDPTLQVACAV